MPYDETQAEALRQALLSEIYAGAFSGGMPAMSVDEDMIQSADFEELRNMARRYGLL